MKKQEIITRLRKFMEDANGKGSWKEFGLTEQKTYLIGQNQTQNNLILTLIASLLSGVTIPDNCICVNACKLKLYRE